MPAISYADWSGGLDLRLPIGIQDANRLYRLQNAYVTSGKKIAKRPALKQVLSGLSGSFGLESFNGQLCVFTNQDSTWVSPSSTIGFYYLDHYTEVPTTATQLVGVEFAKMFQGAPYVVAKHRTYVTVPQPPGVPGPAQFVLSDVYRHHYCDMTPGSLITDSNCPHGRSITIAASRVFSIGGEVVRYCAIGAPRDWTTASDAGFLSVSLQQNTNTECTAVGTFEDALVTFFADGSQVWDVKEDPSANQIRKRMYGVGTNHPGSLASFYRDLAFASPFGLRSIAVQENVERLDESDIGVPIDKLTQPVQEAHEATSDQSVRGIWLQQFGQYWVCYEESGRTRAFVYSFSRSAKLTCWSEYTFPLLFTGITSKGGKVYARTDDALYELDAERYTDEGAPIAVDVQMAFQDAKLPGVEKMFYGADFVFSGTANVSYLYDPRDTSKETNAQPITGDTRQGGLVPVELTAAAVAPRFRHEANEAFELDLCTLYFHPLSAQV